MSPVAVVSCKSYDVACEGVASAVELSGAGSLFAGKRVLLKVNLMKGAAPSLAVNTNPQFVGAVVRCVRAHGGQAVVADSSGVLGLTAEAFAASGIAKASGGSADPARVSSPSTATMSLTPARTP